MKSGKLGGSTQLVGETIHTAGRGWVRNRKKICDIVIDEGRYGKLGAKYSIPIYKAKCDLLEFGMYWVIKLLHGSHSYDFSRTKLPFARTNYTRFKGTK